MHSLGSMALWLRGRRLQVRLGLAGSKNDVSPCCPRCRGCQGSSARTRMCASLGKAGIWLCSDSTSKSFHCISYNVTRTQGKRDGYTRACACSYR